VKEALEMPSRRPGDHGLVAIGRYKVEDGILTMLDDEDRPLRDRKGIVQRTLQPDEDAATIARKLTRDQHLRMSDKNDFSRPLDYGDTGWR
jgi:hypothetical protein